MPINTFRLCLLLGLLLTGKAAYSLTVDCPSLSEAVVEAKFIFDGTVIDKQARRADMPNSKGRTGRIYTYYTFAIHRVFKGRVAGDGKTVTLRIAGGSLGDDSEEVPDLPQYDIDDRAILLMSNNGESMSPLVCWIFQYTIPRPDRLVYYHQIMEKAWFTPKGHLIYKPSEETLRGITERIKDVYEHSKPDITISIEQFFRSDLVKNEYLAYAGGGSLYPDGTWTPPKGAIPYDQDSYAELMGTFIEQALEKQAMQGRLQKTAPLPNLDINRPHYEGTFGEALDEHGKPLPSDNTP